MKFRQPQAKPIFTPETRCHPMRRWIDPQRTGTKYPLRCDSLRLASPLFFFFFLGGGEGLDSIMIRFCFKYVKIMFCTFEDQNPPPWVTFLRAALCSPKKGTYTLISTYIFLYMYMFATMFLRGDGVITYIAMVRSLLSAFSP